jgi:hypothetical protein
VNSQITQAKNEGRIKISFNQLRGIRTKPTDVLHTERISALSTAKIQDKPQVIA